jgi:hypothetical protein
MKTNKEKECDHSWEKVGEWIWEGMTGFGRTERWKGYYYQCTFCGEAMSNEYGQFLGSYQN